MSFGTADLSNPQRFVCGLLSGARLEALDIAPLTAEEAREAVRISKKCWNILPTALEYPTSEYLTLLTNDERQELTALAYGVRAFARLQWQVNSDLLRHIYSKSIRYCLLKGGAAALTLYGDPTKRAAWDLDWGVYRRDIERARRAALEAGYVHAKLDPHINIFTPVGRDALRELEARHYELGYLVKRRYVTALEPTEEAAFRDYDWLGRFVRDAKTGRPWCYAVTDVHHGLSLDIATDELIGDSTEIEWEGFRVRVPSPEWIALHLVFKIYWEGVHEYDKGLYQYADLVRVMRKMDEARFARLESLLERYNLVAAGYFVIRRVVHFGFELDRHHAQFVEASRTPPRDARPADVNDMGDMWGKLWGVR